MRVSDIISRFGTASALARELGVPMTTVASWKQNNQIPAWRQPKLLELAAQRGIELATTDFPSPEERVAA
jgi:hypothetical protein